MAEALALLNSAYMAYPHHLFLTRIIFLNEGIKPRLDKG